MGEILAELFGSYRGVSPSFPLRHGTGSEGRRTRTRFSQMPYLPRFVLCIFPRRRRPICDLQSLDQLLCDGIALRYVIGSEFHQQNSASFGKKIEVCRALLFQPVNDASLKTLKANGLELKNFRNMIRSDECVLVTKADQCSVLRAANQF